MPGVCHMWRREEKVEIHPQWRFLQNKILTYKHVYNILLVVFRDMFEEGDTTLSQVFFDYSIYFIWKLWYRWLNGLWSWQTTSVMPVMHNPPLSSSNLSRFVLNTLPFWILPHQIQFECEVEHTHSQFRPDVYLFIHNLSRSDSRSIINPEPFTDCVSNSFSNECSLLSLDQCHSTHLQTRFNFE